MIHIIRAICEFAIAIVLINFMRKAIRTRFGNGTRIAALILACCAVFLCMSVANSFIPQETVTITALDQKNEQALETNIYLSALTGKGKTLDMPEITDGAWVQQDALYCWYQEGDKHYESWQTDSISFELAPATNLELVFKGNRWKGIVQVTVGEESRTFDTFVDSQDLVNVSVPLTFDAGIIFKSIWLPVCIFAAAFAIGLLVVMALVRLGLHTADRIVDNRKPNGIISRALKYKFLFEELVKRDFKKKYKRTVLGMAWSVLSPMLTLLVMRLVFTHFFGRTTPHYTTYLFCGTLVYSYFNESTTQGMSSLMSNASIITKVNVPKYMFLLSKNVQTLINFGLTLCALFAFCIFDNITFTWKFILLLFPIVTLVLFNIGLGMILSALFVFFRDIQYLWSIFTMLLMYLSAIFYNIESYSLKVRYLFFANPVYLHIRYFRKIVIDSVIPTPAFHLLMLFDVAVVLLLGRWMYKKNSTEFLYYM